MGANENDLFSNAIKLITCDGTIPLRLEEAKIYHEKKNCYVFVSCPICWSGFLLHPLCSILPTVSFDSSFNRRTHFQIAAYSVWRLFLDFNISFDDSF